MSWDLYIVRHAWAGDHGDPQYPDDRLRPLTKDGIKRFHLVAEKLANRGVEVDIIATSPLVRCRQTAEILSHELSGKPKVVELAALAPGSDLQGLLEWTEQQNVDRVAWVGHAPCVGRLCAALIGPDEGAIDFSKGATAAIGFDEPPSVGQGVLRWLVTAKMLGV